jgi:hypothetical protein
VTETDNYTSLHFKVASWKVNVVWQSCSPLQLAGNAGCCAANKLGSCKFLYL